MKNNKLLTSLLNEIVNHKKLMRTFKEMHEIGEKNGEDKKKVSDCKNFYYQHLTAYFALKDVISKAYGDKTAEKVLKNI